MLFDGDDVTNDDPVHRQIAEVFQFTVIYDTMTVYDNLAFPLRNRGVARDEVDARVRGVANMLELDDMLKRGASGLTADSKQKTSLGRGLVRQDVNVIMFDEPLTVIDPHKKWLLRSKLKEVHQRFCSSGCLLIEWRHPPCLRCRSSRSIRRWNSSTRTSLLRWLTACSTFLWP